MPCYDSIFTIHYAQTLTPDVGYLFASSNCTLYFLLPLRQFGHDSLFFLGQSSLFIELYFPDAYLFPVSIIFMGCMKSKVG